MTRIAGLGPGLLALAAVMIALSAVGAYALWQGDHPTVGIIALIQVPFYAIAAWCVLRPAAAPATGSRALYAILAIGVVMRVIIFPAPVASSDLYRYVWDGRVQGAGINPYRYVPNDLALQALRDDEVYASINRVDYAPTIYPPMAQIVYFVATRISDTPIFMKAAMLAFEGLAVWAILQLLAARTLAPARVLLYVWHPLPLWEFAGSGHVDAVAIAFLLLAFVAVDRRSPVLGGVALAASVLVKFFPVVAGPAVYKRWDWRLPVSFLATAVALYLPYLGVGTKVFGFLFGYVADEGIDRGQGLFLWQLVGSVVPLPENALPIYLPVAATVMAVLGLAFALLRREPKADLAAAMILAFVFIVLFSPHYPWYFAWLIPFLCFYPFTAAIYLTCAASYLHISHWPITLTDGLLIYGVSGLVLAVELVIRRYRRKEARRGDTVPA